MERNDIRKIFDAALALEKGKRALISFDSERAAECARVQLYLEKRKYFKANRFDDEELTFGRKYDKDKKEFFLVIEKISRGFNFFVEDEDGKFIKKNIDEIPFEEGNIEVE